MEVVFPESEKLEQTPLSSLSPAPVSDERDVISGEPSVNRSRKLPPLLKKRLLELIAKAQAGSGSGGMQGMRVRRRERRGVRMFDASRRCTWRKSGC